MTARHALATLAAGLFLVPAAAQAPASAQASERLTLGADRRELGWVGLRLHAPPGLQVTIREASGPRIARLTAASLDTHLRRAARWVCERRVRRFVATGSDGQRAEDTVRTPGCGRRLALVAPARAAMGAEVSMRIVDRWSLGAFAARLCVEPPGGPERCDRVRLREGARTAEGAFRALRPGGWRVSARAAWGRAAEPVRVPPPDGTLDVLTTGDSMVQRLDRFLARRLPPSVPVRSDAHPATGISKPGEVDWVAQARLAAATGPDVVVMFIGAGDTFALDGAACCGPRWIAAYARRARSMMASYSRGGRARVLWLLLPAPREGFVRRSFPAVNAAVRRAAAGAPRDVRVVDLVEVFSPGGRYRKWIRVGDREVGVRQSDGIHLSDEGAAIAAEVVISTLRRERILPWPFASAVGLPSMA